MAALVTARVEEQHVFHIRCPHEGCKNELYEKDVAMLVREGPLKPEVEARFNELRARDYTARASSFADEVSKDGTGYALLRRLYDSTRLCPRCSLVIEKSVGCNSFYCICGERFNYAAAPRPIGSGVRRYDRVIDFAEQKGLSISSAERFKGNFRLYEKAGGLASQVNLTFDDALELQLRAYEGDMEARARVRQLREEARAAGREEDELMDLPTLDFTQAAATEGAEHAEGELTQASADRNRALPLEDCIVSISLVKAPSDTKTVILTPLQRAVSAT